MRTILILAAALLLPSAARAETCFLVDPSNVVHETLRTTGACPPNPAGKPRRWVAHRLVKPAFDPATQVIEGPVRTYSQMEATDTWTVRAKSPAELDADKYVKVDGIDVATFRALCHLKNEIRMRVQSLPAWSDAQCRDAFKSLIP